MADSLPTTSGAPARALDQAIARNNAAVLSLPSAGMLRHHKSRFLTSCGEGIWIESAPDDNTLIDELVSHNSPVVISFKTAQSKESFAAVILRREQQYRINDHTIVEALLLRRPADGDIKVVQRRSDYRVRVIGEVGLTARIWRIAERVELRKMPTAAQEIRGQLYDISLGGIGVTVSLAAPLQPSQSAASAGPTDQLGAKGASVMDNKVRLLLDERIRIELISTQGRFLIEGRVRHLPGKNRAGHGPQTRLGVRFKLPNDFEGRKLLAMLTRIVGKVHRDEVRRIRLGLIDPTAAQAGRTPPISVASRTPLLQR